MKKTRFSVGLMLASALFMTLPLSASEPADVEYAGSVTITRPAFSENGKKSPFGDVEGTSPYLDAVIFVTENGLFNGTSADTFSPDENMTRAMFATILGRLDGADVTSYTVPTFSDVATGQWYTSYVEWAAANGVVNGIGNGLFGVNDAVTVEQVCVMLNRYANGKKPVGGDVPNATSLSEFTDSASVSAWAEDAVKWAVANGIYAPTNGKLDPVSPASRALTAQMLYNYVKIFGR